MANKGYFTDIPTDPRKLICTSDGAPDFAPDFVGQLCFRTDTGKYYIAAGATGSDWKLVTSAS